MQITMTPRPAATQTLDPRAQRAVDAQLRQLGPYRLRELLGEGGMGVVWLAEQSAPVQRLVAIKVTRIDLATVGRLARFEAERQILATLRHPRIAQVFDAGETPEGFPYLVMEYVPGAPLDEYCDAHRLDLAQRIRLLIQACAALTHAHQQGVIHRDVKPANLLVEGSAGGHYLKLIDFGIARLIRSTDPRLTQTGHSPGTPQYMSPEQRRGHAAVDTRSDIYALGVTACQLLAGHLPNPGADSQPALEPSRTLEHAHDPAALAALRQLSAGELRARLRGDLDRIIAKATHPQPELRYASVSELAEDFERHLAGLPVRATPPTFGYVLRKWVARHRFETVAVVLVLLLTTLAGVGLWQAWRQERLARAAAEAQLQLHQQMNDFTVHMLALLRTELGARPWSSSELFAVTRREARQWFGRTNWLAGATVEMLLRNAEQRTAGDRAQDADRTAGPDPAAMAR